MSARPGLAVVAPSSRNRVSATSSPAFLEPCYEASKGQPCTPGWMSDSGGPCRVLWRGASFRRGEVPFLHSLDGAETAADHVFRRSTPAKFHSRWRDSRSRKERLRAGRWKDAEVQAWRGGSRLLFPNRCPASRPTSPLQRHIVPTARLRRRLLRHSVMAMILHASTDRHCAALRPLRAVCGAGYLAISTSPSALQALGRTNCSP